MTIRSSTPTLLRRLPHARGEDILDAAGSIAHRLSFSQPHIDKIKHSLLRCLEGRPDQGDRAILENILTLIQKNQLSVVLLLAKKECLQGHLKLAKNVIVDVVSKIEDILRQDPIGDTQFPRCLPSALDTVLEEEADTDSSLSPQSEQETVSDEEEIIQERHDKTKRNTFPIWHRQRVIIQPRKEGGYRVEVKDKSRVVDGHICMDYSSERNKVWRYLTLYDNEGEIVWGYTLVG